jgi:hypothetical protein
VIVYPGTYTENIDFKGKNITLRSEDPEIDDTVVHTAIEPHQKQPEHPERRGNGGSGERPSHRPREHFFR